MPLNKNEKSIYAYFQLVKNDNDLIGMIGYSLYKKTKIEYIEKYFRHYKKYPTDDELRKFQLEQCGSTNVNSHRKYAENLINTFINKYLEENQKEIYEKNKYLEIELPKIDNREKTLIEKEKKLKLQEKDVSKKLTEVKKIKCGHFFYGVLQSLVATVVLTIITVIVLLIAKVPSNYAEMIANLIQKNN